MTAPRHDAVFRRQRNQMLTAPLDHDNGEARQHVTRSARRGAKRGWIVRAIGADAGVAGLLKHRGYVWNASREVWCRTIDDDHLVGEMIWLNANVYASDVNSSSICPTLERAKSRRRTA